MRSRLGLDEIFKEITPNVYFQPPESIKMKYPCIIYKLDDIRAMAADNMKYFSMKCYQVIVVSKDPDTDIINKLVILPMCRYIRHYVADNLNHDVFEIYY